MDVELLQQQCDFATSVKIDRHEEDKMVVVTDDGKNEESKYDFILVPRALMREILSKLPNASNITYEAEE